MDQQQAENAGKNQGAQMDAEILSYANLAENSGKGISGTEGVDGISVGTAGQQPPDYSSDLDLAKKIINPDDPKKNLYNTMREYKRKAEEFQKKFDDLNGQYETFKKSNISTAEKLDKLIEFQKNPEYIEFERFDESEVKQLITYDPEKAQRYYNWLLLKQTAEKSKSGDADASELQKKKDDEAKERQNMAQAALSDGCNSIKEKFKDEITPEKLQEIVSQTNYEDVYLVSQLKNNNFDKVLTKDQRKLIAHSYLKELKEAQKNEPPYSLTSGSGSTPPIASDDDDNISSFSDLAKAVIKNQNKK
jgi:hypothetical protein